MTTTSPPQFITRAKGSGGIPPMLLPSEGVDVGDAFLKACGELVRDQGLGLRNSTTVVGQFQSALKMTETASRTLMNPSDFKTRLAQDRAILLMIIGSTETTSEQLMQILNNGFLVTVKSWLDELLESNIGGVDLLLHMLRNISNLPVTKDMVTSSNLGKKVASLEKHKICIGGSNESIIKDLVQKVKTEWSASVKKHKLKAQANQSKGGVKRTLEATSSKSDTKKPRVALSSLIKKASGSSSMIDEPMKDDKSKPESATTPFMGVKKADIANLKEDVAMIDVKSSNASVENNKTNKAKKQIRWADYCGEELLRVQQIEGENNVVTDQKLVSVGTSWSDQRKRDRDHEKSLFEKAKKSKLIDTEDNLDTMAMMHKRWHAPIPLPADNQNPPVQVDSKEVAAQKTRMASVLPVNYLTEEDVPNNPTPVSDAEQAIDMSNQSSSISIPFFAPAPQEASLPAPVPAPLPAPIPALPQVPAPVASGMLPIPPTPPVPPAPPANPNIATPEVVQAMGLPPFLVGQNLQALQTIVASPGLLKAFVDVNGNYDQVRILSLVQTLTQSQQPQVPQPPTTTYAPNAGINAQQPYGQASYTAPAQLPTPQSTIYGNKPTPSTTSSYSKNGYRGDQNGNEGNLHLSGFGPSTTPEAVRVLFSPYVQVDEVVPKNGFMFVNTSDAEGAKRAREALNGVMLGGSPLRINLALRRTKNPSQAGAHSGPVDASPLPLNALGQVDYDSVRDDRGNPATKNLFVAGYGPGTTEQELKNVFNQHTQVSGVVIKGNFAFVNTIEKKSAVAARQHLTGATLNGGVLRINFAKESGRLGTSFDNGYASKPSSQTSYYGRSY